MNTTYSLTISDIIGIIKNTKDINLNNTTNLSLAIESYLLEKQSTDPNLNKERILACMRGLDDINLSLNSIENPSPKFRNAKNATLFTLYKMGRIDEEDYKEFLLSEDPLFTPKLLPWD